MTIRELNLYDGHDTPQCSQAMKDKQHNKNARVNACILSQILQLPFNCKDLKICMGGE